MSRQKTERLIVKVLKDDEAELDLIIKLLAPLRFLPCPNTLLSGHCWVRGNDSSVYTSILYNEEYEHAHRISYEIFNGRELKHFGLHHCDVKACINPDHLYDGTAKDNAEDVRSRNIEFSNSYFVAKRKVKKLKQQNKKDMIALARLNSDISRGLAITLVDKTISNPTTVKEACGIIESLKKRLI